MSAQPSAKFGSPYTGRNRLLIALGTANFLSALGGGIVLTAALEAFVNQPPAGGALLPILIGSALAAVVLQAVRRWRGRHRAALFSAVTGALSLVLFYVKDISQTRGSWVLPIVLLLLTLRWASSYVTRALRTETAASYTSQVSLADSTYFIGLTAGLIASVFVPNTTLWTALSVDVVFQFVAAGIDAVVGELAGGGTREHELASAPAVAPPTFKAVEFWRVVVGAGTMTAGLQMLIFAYAESMADSREKIRASLVLAAFYAASAGVTAFAGSGRLTFDREDSSRFDVGSIGYDGRPARRVRLPVLTIGATALVIGLVRSPMLSLAAILGIVVAASFVFGTTTTPLLRHGALLAHEGQQRDKLARAYGSMALVSALTFWALMRWPDIRVNVALSALIITTLAISWPVRAPARVRRIPVPAPLPTDMARVAAVSTALATGAIAAWAFGGLGAIELAALTLGPLLIFVAIRFGLPLPAFLAAALIASGASVAIVAGVTIPLLTLSLVPLTVMVILIPIAWSVPKRLSLGSALIVVGAVGVAATLGPAFVAAAVYRTVTQGHGTTVLAIAAVAPAAWAASALGRDEMLSTGVVLASIRNAVFTALTAVAGLVAALSIGSRIDGVLHTFGTATPLESLIPTVVWLVSALVAGSVAWVAFWLPRSLARAQVRGRLDATAISEPLVFTIFAIAVAGILWRRDAGMLWRDSCVALAGAMGYVWCRVRYSRPVEAANHPLWILVPEENARFDTRASRIASAWKWGQVTLLATPSAAEHMGGEHLRAAILAGRGTTLFPTRFVHLEDWDDTQPSCWKALPVRELYAPGELWPRILAERVTEPARVLMLEAYLEAEPQHNANEPSGVDRWIGAIRGFLGLDRSVPRPTASTTNIEVRGAMLPLSLAPPLFRDWPPDTQEEVLPAGIAFTHGTDQLVELLDDQRPALEVDTVRSVILQGASKDDALARAIARELDGTRDTAGRLLESWSTGAVTTGWFVTRTPVGISRDAMILLSRLFYERPTASVFSRLIGLLMSILFARGRTVAFELVTIEGDSASLFLGLQKDLVEGTDRRVFTSIVAVRSAAAEAARTLSYRADLYSGQVLLDRSKPIEITAPQIAGKLRSGTLSPLLEASAKTPLEPTVPQDAVPA